jgi:hypothetical protein
MQFASPMALLAPLVVVAVLRMLGGSNVVCWQQQQHGQRTAW